MVMVDYDTMGPSLQRFGARFLKFSPTWQSCDFEVRKMSICRHSPESKWVLSPHCLKLEACEYDCT